jgi:hypothetical protein
VTGFLERQPTKESQLGDPALAEIELGQSRQRFVERQHIDVGRPAFSQPVIERDLHPPSGTLGHAPTARVVHQNAAHDLGRHAEELRAVLPRGAVLFDQSEVCLVDEGRRLEGMLATLSPQVGRGAAMQFLIDQRHELVARGGIPSSPRL